MHFIMKVAVCIYGEIRGTPEVWQRIHDYLVAPNNADVFINNVYYNPTFIDDMNIDEASKEYLRLYYDSKGVHLTPPKELFNILSPKEYLLQSRPCYPNVDLPAIQSKFSHRSMVPGQSSNPLEYHTLLNQNESRMWCLQMRHLHERRTQVKYDVVIMTRLDANVIAPLHIDQEAFKHDVFAKYCGGRAKIFEQLIFGSAEKMDVLCGYFEALPKLYIELCNDSVPIGMNEYFIAQFLIRNGIYVHHYEVPLDFNTHNNGLARSSNSFQC